MKAENDLLAAEGYIRTGKIAEAAAKIDLSRVANGGLPALTGVVTTGDAGGAGRRVMRAAGTEWHGRRRLRQHLRGDEIREAHREHVLGLRQVLDGRPRMGRSGRRHGARVPGSLSGNAVETEAVLPAWAADSAAPRQRECTDSDAVAARSSRRVVGVGGSRSKHQACYEYVPIASAAPPVGQLVELQVTDRGRVGLGDRFGPGVQFIMGRLVSEQGNDLVISVGSVKNIDGETHAVER